jgi:hypothetical protein
MEYITAALNIGGLGLLGWWIWDTNKRMAAVEDLSLVLAETLNNIIDAATKQAELEIEENNKRVLYSDKT